MADLINASPDTKSRHSDEHVDRMLDEAIEDSFPASDPVSLAMPHQRSVHEGRKAGSGRGAAVAAALPLLIIGGIILGLMLRRAGH